MDKQYFGEILWTKSKLSCQLGEIEKGEPVQVIRHRLDGTLDIVNLTNNVVFKVHVNLLKSSQA